MGLVLGVRNFSQQGMFIVGGTLADRLGYKPLIVAGCLLRTGGFALLIFATSLPMVLIASAATGFAGALFNPAVRAYLAADSGERRLDAFAMFNVFYQAGILAGPLIGLALVAVDFRVTASGAALVFAVLTIAQLCALPQHNADPRTEATSVIDNWRVVLGNRAFLLFSVAMAASCVLSFQIYLALPLQASARCRISNRTGIGAVRGFWARHSVGPDADHPVAIGAVGNRAQPRARHVHPGGGVRAAPRPSDSQTSGVVPAVVALLVTTTVLAVGTAAVFPFEMDTVVSLSRARLVATHYGFYNTIVGVVFLSGNVATGSIMSAARSFGATQVIWGAIVLVGLVAAFALHCMRRRELLSPPVEVQPTSSPS